MSLMRIRLIESEIYGGNILIDINVDRVAYKLFYSNSTIGRERRVRVLQRFVGLQN